jgi:hypothetical protein
VILSVSFVGPGEDCMCELTACKNSFYIFISFSAFKHEMFYESRYVCVWRWCEFSLLVGK